MHNLKSRADAMTAKTITEQDWLDALREEQQAASNYDNPPSDQWKTGPEIAKLLGVNPSIAHRYIPKTWETRKFRRITRGGIRPILHYKLPLPSGALAGSGPHLDAGAPALPASNVKRGRLSRPVPARSARRKP